MRAAPRRGGASGRTAARAWLGAAVVATAAATLGACVAARSAGGARGQAAVGASAFARGADAYGRGDLAAARAAFDEAAARAPRAPDAWANAGTAAWAQADTLGAAVAWQRALRLEPAARDLRARLALLPAAQDGWVAGVPPVDPNWPGTVAATLAAAVGLLAVGAALPVRRAAARSAGAGARAAWPWAWGAALALGGAGASLARHADPSDRAIVTRAGSLRAEPALTADPGPPVDPTDVVRLAERTGPWVRVALDGGREGWIEAARLAPLALPAPAPAEARARGR
jgi:tetratricopeptide (TPR) repeat protein